RDLSCYPYPFASRIDEDENLVNKELSYGLSQITDPGDYLLLPCVARNVSEFDRGGDHGVYAESLKQLLGERTESQGKLVLGFPCSRLFLPYLVDGIGNYLRSGNIVRVGIVNAEKGEAELVVHIDHVVLEVLAEPVNLVMEGAEEIILQVMLHEASHWYGGGFRRLDGCQDSPCVRK